MRRIAKVEIGHEILARLIKLPVGSKIVMVKQDNFVSHISIFVENPDLEELAISACPPTVSYSVTEGQDYGSWDGDDNRPGLAIEDELASLDRGDA